MSAGELEALQRLAADLLKLAATALDAQVEAGALQEICHDPETQREKPSLEGGARSRP